MATSVNLSSAPDQAHQDRPARDSQRSAGRARGVSLNATTRRLTRSSASRPSPKLGSNEQFALAGVLVALAGVLVALAGSSTPTAFRYRIRIRPPLDIAYYCDP
jgi:hypothetical protein